MYIVDRNVEDFVSFLIQARPLTDEQKLALRNELTNDPENLGYVGKSNEECLRLLTFGYYKEVTIPASRTNKGLVDMGTIRVFLTEQTNDQGVPYIAILRMLKDSPDMQTKVLGIVAEEVLGWVGINTADSRVIEKFETLKLAGVLSEAVVNWILYNDIPERTEQAYQTPRNIAIGLNCIPTVSEVGEARS